MASTRLPGKVLKPIGGLPLVIVAAKRSQNKGRRVIVATSDEPQDDAVNDLVQSEGIECFRGSHLNLLDRYYRAWQWLGEPERLFRLTADNILPDGEMLDQMEASFIDLKADYMTNAGPKSGFPVWGAGAELFTSKALQDAHAQATTAHDQEHVTPFIKRTYPNHVFDKYKALNCHDVRLTVDTQDDYDFVAKVADLCQPILECPFLDLLQMAARHTPDTGQEQHS
jgi:spore coat polysaccharide biosynthesis protein SpsF